MLDNKPKRKMKEIIIPAIGGKRNGTGDTWTFTTAQLRKIALIISFIISSVVALTAQINTFRGIPFRLNVLESNEVKLTKKVDKNTEHIKSIKDNTSSIKDDMKFIKDLLIMRNR